MDSKRLRGFHMPSLILGTVGVFIAVTGLGSAASLITGASVKNGSLTGLDIKDGSLRAVDLRNSSVTGAKVRDGALTSVDFAGGVYTKAESDGKYLGKTEGDPKYLGKTEGDSKYLGKTEKAADADKLDGVDSSAFVKGSGTLQFGARDVATGGAAVTLSEISGVGTLLMTCPAGIATVNLVNESGSTADVISPAGFTSLANGASTQLIAAGVGGAINTVQFRENSGSVFATRGYATIIVSGVGAATCRANAEVMTHTFGITFLPPIIINP